MSFLDGSKETGCQDLVLSITSSFYCIQATSKSFPKGTIILLVVVVVSVMAAFGELRRRDCCDREVLRVRDDDEPVTSAVQPTQQKNGSE
jgi:hypothetical protein